MKKSRYSNSAYGKMRERMKEREERENDYGKNYSRCKKYLLVY